LTAGQQQPVDSGTPLRADHSMAHSPATRGLVRCWPRTTRPHRGLTNQPVNSGPFGIPEHGKQRWRCAGQQGAARFPPRPGSAGWRHVRAPGARGCVVPGARASPRATRGNPCASGNSHSARSGAPAATAGLAGSALAASRFLCLRGWPSLIHSSFVSLA
jgi:hypothetical protein